MFEKQNEKLLHREENEYLKISEDGTEASGIYFPNAVLTFRDGDSSVISYSDTGVFILFRGSDINSKNIISEKYLDENSRTIKDVVFQSRNMAAKAVLGDKGCTNSWKKTKIRRMQNDKENNICLFNYGYNFWGYVVAEKHQKA